MKKLLYIFIISIILNAKIINLTNIEHYKLSYKYERLQEYIKAIKELQEIKKIKYPYLYYYRLGWLYYLLKNYQLSNKYLLKTLKYYPNSIETKLLIIRNYLNLKKYKEALNLGNGIIRKDYYNYYGNYYTALALYKIKNYNVSLNISLKMLSLYPSDKIFLDLLAKNYLKLKKYKEYNRIMDIINYLK